MCGIAISRLATLQQYMCGIATGRLETLQQYLLQGVCHGHGLYAGRKQDRAKCTPNMQSFSCLGDGTSQVSGLG